MKRGRLFEEMEINFPELKKDKRLQFCFLKLSYGANIDIQKAIHT